jgi:hypothetical protein
MLRDHAIKAGFDFNHVNSRRDILPIEEGNYGYATINDFIIDYANFAVAGALRSAGRVCSSSTRIAGQCYARQLHPVIWSSSLRIQDERLRLLFSRRLPAVISHDAEPRPAV